MEFPHYQTIKVVSKEKAAFQNCILPVFLKISATTVQGMNLITLDSILAYKAEKNH